MNNYRIILKNTASLYIRMICLTLISLYTVRVVLNILGASDYGLYNVVGGIVSMFSFVSGTLTNASQRYFAYYLANDDWKGVSKYFSINLVIYVSVIIFVVLFSETIGLWFLLNKMNIDTSRLNAAILVFHLSIFTFAFGFIVTPFQALLIGDENLTIYAIMSILEGVLKLVLVYLLDITTGDKLIAYAWLMFWARLAINFIYMFYVKKKYKLLKFNFIKSKDEYKKVFSYVNWNFIGSFAAVGKSQGINIIMNIFFGVIINAARGIAYQISSVVSQFAGNFMQAISPQITKSYALAKYERMFALIEVGSKISFYLLYIVILPLSLNINYILLLWLKKMPDYTGIFTILVLIDLLIDSITNPILTAIQATGNIRKYQSVVGSLYLLNLPISYLLLIIFRNPLVPFIVGICVSIIAVIARIIVARAQLRMNTFSYIKSAVVPIIYIVIFSLPLTYFLVPKAQNFMQLLRNTFFSLCIVSVIIYAVGLNSAEKSMLKTIIKWGRQIDGK